MKQQEEKAKKEQMDHEARDRWRRELAQSGHLAVQNQLSMQAAERQRRHEEELRYLEKIRKENSIAEAKELDKVRMKREAVLANAESLRQQMLEKQEMSPGKKVGLAQMNEIERQ